MPIYSGRDVATGELVWIPGNKVQAEAFWADVKSDRIWKRWRREFGDTESNRNYVVNFALNKLFPDAPYFTTSMFLKAVEIAMNDALSGLTRKATEPEPVEEAPQPVHRGQELWRSHAEFMEHGGPNGTMPSGDQVRARAREDKSFRAYLQQGYEARMSQPIDGQGTILNAPSVSSDKKPSQEVLDWVEWYRRTAIAEVRMKLRSDANLGGFEHENRMFRTACECGLI